jgi:hypothetical protein
MAKLVRIPRSTLSDAIDRAYEGKPKPNVMDPKGWKPDKKIPPIKLNTETFSQKYRRYEAELAKVPAGFSAMKWLFNKIQDSGRNGFISRPLIGSCVAFQYDPKLKKTLPYYDTCPLVFVIKNYPDGFLGINLHYIPPGGRRKVIQEILRAPKMNAKTGDKLMAPATAIAAGFPSGWRKCFKRYLKSHVQTSFINIPEEEWLIATLLPMAAFAKGGQTAAWKDVR